jgi:hypothetical protein
MSWRPEDDVFEVRVDGYYITEEMLDDDAYYGLSIMEQSRGEREMNIYQAVVVKTNKKGEYREIEFSGAVLAKDEEAAKMRALAIVLEDYYGPKDEARPSLERLKVVVRPF